MSDNTPIHLPPEDDEISLVDLAAVIWRWKLLVLGLPFLVGLGTVIYAVISIVLPPETSPMPNFFRPQALVLMGDGGSSQNAALAALAQSGLGNLAGLAGARGGGQGELAKRLLTGNTIVDHIVREFQIIQRHGIEDAARDNARKLVREKMSVDYDLATGILSVSYEDIDPAFASEVVNRLVELLDRRFATIGSNRSVREVELLERKLSEVEQEIAFFEEEIKAFQRRHGTISPDAYATEQVRILAEMRARLINKEIELQTYGEFARVDDPVAGRLRAERDQLRQAISEMERRYFGGGTPASGQGVLDGIDPQDIPELSVRFGRLERELRVQSRIFEVLTQQYEVARLSADGEALRMQILELSEPPQLKAGPSRALLVIVATFAAGFFAVFLAFLLEFINNLRRDPEVTAKFRASPNRP
ncbi:hypothetical protein AU468_13450 [Alkalispirochaeta sphaeroplastigenens]|uniref:Polysaccharide chain length determinant N-terminal domain-containing protein n=1 Tax=Alkalispirochaeta sphaeroplastigenens TaxID=1187066 RepID=A0A2S4JFL8_9SPIO|nr:hypothetical protein [Alkalispirochaeta sphaeroplastigenens]POQ98357.1 hypothetical protein AU468_13450 [Alkalispirochaeta sphaeroplastigenens]